MRPDTQLRNVTFQHCFAVAAFGEPFILQIDRNIGGCRGGSICDAQPLVLILNKATLQVEYGFQGSVFAQLGDTPTGYETLYTGPECDLNGCGQQVSGSLASVSFQNGIAEFEVSTSPLSISIHA